MLFDVLAVLCLSLGWWYVWCQPKDTSGPLLHPDDMPPPAARTDVPTGRRRLTHYVEAGLAEADAYLRGTERNA